MTGRRRLRPILAACALLPTLAAGLTGCGGSSLQAGGFRLVPSGNSLSFSNGASGGVSLQVPGGAVGNATQIALNPAAAGSYPSTFPSGTTLVPNTAYAVTPGGLAFSKPVTLTIQFDPTKVPTATTKNDLRLFTVASVNGKTQWVAVPLDNGVDLSTSPTKPFPTVTATIMQLSTSGIYGVFLQDPNLLPPPPV